MLSMTKYKLAGNFEKVKSGENKSGADITSCFSLPKGDLGELWDTAECRRVAA